MLGRSSLLALLCRKVGVAADSSTEGCVYCAGRDGAIFLFWFFDMPSGCMVNALGVEN
jgi:hypothetical protein